MTNNKRVITKPGVMNLTGLMKKKLTDILGALEKLKPSVRKGSRWL